MFISVAVFASIAVALLVVWRSRLIVENEALEKLSFQTQYLASTFDQERAQLKNYADAIEAAARSLYPREGLTKDNIESYKDDLLLFLHALADTIHPLSLWLVLSADLPTEGHNLALYDAEHDGTYTITPFYNLKSMDMTADSMRWWTQCVSEGEVWTEPYYWEKWDMELITYSRALYIDGVFIGCLGSDFNFSEKRILWSRTKVYETGYIFLMNEELQFIYHPSFTGENAKQVLDESLFNTLAKNITDRSLGAIEYTFSGILKVMSYRQLSNGWVLFVTTPKTEILKGFHRIGNELVLIILLVAGLSILVSIKFSQSITAPIHALVASFAKARAGSLETRADIRTNDEMQMLGDQFNYFMSEMQHMLSRLKKDEEELIREKERAETSDRLKTSFLANLSHEIRTPLNCIVSFSEFLLDSDFTEEERREFVNTIHSNNSKLLKFIEDTLQFSQLEQHQIQAKLQTFPLSWIEDHLSLAFEKVITQNLNALQITISGKSHSEITQIQTDPELLRKIMEILTENALKFTQTGEIELKFAESTEGWEFVVRDTGIGIPAASIDHVFEKFYKDESNKNLLHDGLGLGLSIARSLVTLLGGEISVESTEGVGSRFIVRFPNRSENRSDVISI